MTAAGSRRAGKFGRRRGVPIPTSLCSLGAYLADPLRAAPGERPAPTVASWGMFGNDTYGDCTCAGYAHQRMANAATLGEAVPAFSDGQVVEAYFALGGDPDPADESTWVAGGPYDKGLAEVDVLHAAYTTGLYGAKAAGYAPFGDSRAELCSVVAAFGAAYLGIVVPSTMQAQFEAGEEGHKAGTLTGDGHCVTAVGYDDRHVELVTWGELWPVTWSWLQWCTEERWAVITPEDTQVDLAALQTDLASIGDVDPAGDT